MSAKPLLRLHQLLVALLTPSELRSFIQLHLDAALVRCLPAEATYNDVVYHVVDAMERLGFLLSDLFDGLVEARPHREAEIRQVQEEVLPGSNTTTLERKAAFEKLIRDLDTIGQDKNSPVYFQQLVEVVKRGFRDLYPARVTNGLRSLTMFLVEFAYGGWDRILDRSKGELISTDEIS